MEALSALGVVNKTLAEQDHPGHPEARITLTERFDCFASDDCKALMSQVTPQQNDNRPTG